LQPRRPRQTALGGQGCKSPVEITGHGRHIARRQQRTDTRLEGRHPAVAAARALRKKHINQAILAEALTQQGQILASRGLAFQRQGIDRQCGEERAGE